MDRETDSDEDLRLAIRLSEIESQYSRPNTSVASDEDEDYQYALKLSKALNSPSTSNPSSTWSFENKPNSDSSIRTNQSAQHHDITFENTVNSSKNNEISEFKFAEDIIDEDYLLAVELAEKDFLNSPRESKKKDDILDSDYQFALKLAEEESSSSSSYSNSESSVSTVRLENKNFSEKPAFSSGISNEDLPFTAQLFDSDDSDVELIEEPKKAYTSKVNFILHNKVP